jgi:heptaprenyl diphosphate synthase
VRDDILDIVGTEAELGKPAGQDLAEGIYTLPVLYALADPIAGPELGPLLGQPLGQPERDKARSIVAESGSIAAAVVVARQYAELAGTAAWSASATLAAGFANLAHSLVDDLPAL